jgi:iron complex outermembrane receptor protein
VKLDGVLNIPLGENVDSRFAASYARDDGYVTNIDPNMHRSQDKNTFVMSGKIIARPTDNLTLKLSGMYGRKNDWSTTLINLYPDYRNVGVALGGTPSPGFYVTSMNFAKDPSVSSYFRNASVALRADLDLGGATLSSITGYLDTRSVTSFDVDTTEISWQHGDKWDRTKAFSQEIQAVSNGDGPFKWTAGLYYYKENSWMEEDIFGTSQGAPEGIDLQSAATSGGPYLYTYNTIKVEAFAPYAQATFKINDQWSITAGARYTWETKKMPTHYAWRVPVSGDPTVLVDELAQKLSFQKFTPKIGLEFRPNRDVLLYAQWSRGYKSGGFNTPAFGAAPQVEPETLDAFEAGWKTEMGAIRFNGAAFYYDYKDIQIARSQAGIGVVVQNAASSKVYGAEAEIVYQPNDRFSLAASGAWTHSEFTNFTGDALAQNSLSAACTAAGGPQVAGATAACRGFSLVPNTDFKGQPLPLAPKWTGNIRAQYKIPLSDELGSVTLNSLVSYTSKFNWGTGPTYLAESGYFLTTLGATWTAPDETLEVTVSADNIFDVKYRSAVVANTTGGYYYPGTPRWWRIKATKKF